MATHSNTNAEPAGDREMSPAIAATWDRQDALWLFYEEDSPVEDGRYIRVSDALVRPIRT